MQLKNIEIKGFKSFADKTVINFDEKITGIVGPNGCGKSNVVDAVRWVLGEQRSSALRSNKMDNLIFNGTSKRRSAGLAEVSLTFENTKNLLPTEFNSVRVTRMLHRSGESEYRLNEVSCRLKDITNLFTDTGISSDSYAIIELKMIDDILNDQENSRKRLFDNAAGISKYKKRKREAMLKLNSTGGDLDRVEDLLHEIESNMKIYESQARKAERYKKLKVKYKDNSLQLGRLHLLGYNEGFSKLQENKNKKTDEVVGFNTNIQQLEAAIEKQKKLTLDKEKALAEVQKKLNEHLDFLRSKENEKNLVNENLKFLRQQLGEYDSNKHNNVKTIDQLNVDIKALNENLITVTKNLGEAEQLYLQKEQKVKDQSEDFSEKNRVFIEDKKELAEIEKQIFELEKKVAVSQSQKLALQKEITEKTEQLSDREKEIINLKKEFTESEAALKIAETALEVLQKKEQQEQANIADLEQQITVIQTQLQKENRELDKKTNEHNLLKDLVDKLEGFPESIRFLNLNKQWSKSSPLLSDIINCKEEYKISIENYLEKYLNYYVVDDIEAAVNAIGLLSDAAKGRANFFVLNQIEQPHIETVLPINGAVMATEIIEYDAKYKNLVAHLLGNVYLVGDNQLNEVKKLIKTNNNIYLAKSGQFYATKYSISGGSIGLFEGKKLGRVQKLAKLSKLIKTIAQNSQQLQAKLNQIEQQRTTLKRSDIRHQIELKNKEANRLNNNLISAKTRYENLEQYLTENQTHHTDITDKFQFIDGQIATINTQLEGVSKNRNGIKDKVMAAETAFNKANELLNEYKTALNEVNIKRLQIKNETNTINQQLTFKSQAIDKEKQLLENAFKAIENTKVEITGLEGKLNNDTVDLSDLYDKKDKISQNVVQVETDYFNAKEVIDDFDKQLRQKQKLKQNQELSISETNNKINDLKLKIVSLKDRISIEFNINVESLLEEAHATKAPLTELEMQVEKYRRRIENYGEVNTMAIDAYNEIKERYEFINTQKADLLEAKDKILETIDEIETTATEKFLDAFNLIRTNFINVFRELFTEGDTCDLKLMDEANPMESKIEIIAKPKGKRPLTINQLSGGEKTLTAISLVFALYLLKPAPFCILDEVDAPLDDSNLSKFNQIIRKFSSDSQFIIVTHNKMTMSSVDIIYGVTMMETGISTVVPVDFRNLN